MEVFLLRWKRGEVRDRFGARSRVGVGRAGFSVFVQLWSIDTCTANKGFRLLIRRRFEMDGMRNTPSIRGAGRIMLERIKFPTAGAPIENFLPSL